MNKTQLKNWLSKTEIPLSKVSSNTGISRKTLYNWINGSPIRDNNMIKLYNAYKHEIEHCEIVLEGEKVEMNSKYVIDLQADKIEYQNKEIKTLKNALSNKQAESTHWESLEYDYIAETTLIQQRFKLGRVIKRVTDLKRQSDILGYSEKELSNMWDVGVQHIDINDHPIEKIISKETQREIKKQSLTLPIIFNALKSSVGDHYIPQPIMYIHKKGHHIGAIAYCKVEWSKMNVISKVQFLTGDQSIS